MLKVEISNGATKVECSGEIITIICELATIIKALYGNIHQSNPIAAELFRSTLNSMLTDEDSPIWEDQEAPGTGYCVIVPVKNKGGL